MGRGKKQVEGQVAFNFNLDSDNYVCQANTLIGGKQALKLNSAKLIRAAIMQVVRDDAELKPYIITVPELSNLLRISESNIYRDIDKITDDIISNPVYVCEDTGTKVRWIKIPWVTKCEYNSDVGVLIKLNDELKPFLLNLKEHYTQYTLESILIMKSVYAIRIYELLLSRIYTKVLPKDGIDIEISLEQIRDCCDCNSKGYNKFSNFKNRVLDVAVLEINEKTMFRLDYSYIKQGRTIVGIVFHLNMHYH